MKQSQIQKAMYFLGYQDKVGGQITPSSPISQLSDFGEPLPITNKWLKLWKMSYSVVLLGLEYISLQIQYLFDWIYNKTRNKRMDIYCDVYGLSYDQYEENMDKWPLKSVRKDGK